MKIGILHHDLEEQEKIIAEELIKNGFEVKLYDLRKVSLEELKRNDVILNRVFASVANRNYNDNLMALEQLRYLENCGVTCLNSYFTTKCDYSKHFSAQIMIEKGILSPDTFLIKSMDQLEDAKKFAEKYGLEKGIPIVLKRDIGGRGKDIHLIKNVDDLEKKIKMALLDAKDDGYSSGYVLQEFIESVLPHDYRVSIVNGEIIYSMTRSFIKDRESNKTWISSMTLGSKEKYVKLPDKIRDISLRATKAIGAFFNDTDVIVSAKGPYIIENNPTPNFAKRQVGNESSKREVVISKLVEEIRRIRDGK